VIIIIRLNGLYFVAFTPLSHVISAWVHACNSKPVFSFVLHSIY